MFDKIAGTCPNCGENFTVQTKLCECAFKIFTIGSNFPVIENGVIELKDCCQKCGGTILALIQNSKIEAFVRNNYQASIVYREGAWGYLFQQYNKKEDCDV